MNLIYIQELNDYILSFLDFNDIGKVYTLSKVNKSFVLDLITNKYSLKTYLNKYTCFCNICDRLYTSPMQLKPKLVNNQVVLTCVWNR
jgi:hypothetical protein